MFVSNENVYGICRPSSISIIIILFITCYVINESVFALKPDTSTISIKSDEMIDEFEEKCNEFHKECHCGSIAHGDGISLFTRIVYPNSTTIIEEYDEDVPYGYKVLRVFYRCTNKENVLVGNSMRECVNGNWIGPVPRCAFNLGNSSKLTQVKISDYNYDDDESKNRVVNQTHLNNSTNVTIPLKLPINSINVYYDKDLKLVPTGVFELPLSTQPAQCLPWSLSPHQVWSFTLDKPTRIHYVRIKLYGDHIEDLYLNHEISFSISLKNITYIDGSLDITDPLNQIPMPIDLKCTETNPDESQYEDSYKQKYSANYLVLDFDCEMETEQKTIFEFFFTYDYEVDQLYSNRIEVRFNLNNFHIDNEHGDIEMKKKISVTSLCELKLYSFNSDCGDPDIPVHAIVQKDFNFNEEIEKKSYKFLCNDKSHELKGNSFVECGSYGKWKNEFPQCERIQPCRLLNNVSTNKDFTLEVNYEKITFTKSGNLVVPNDKYARLTCRRKKILPSMSVTNETMKKYDDNHLTQLTCHNGRWIGLETINSNCITFPRVSTEKPTSQIVNNSTLEDPSMQLISLPVRLIRILLALFIILCLIIVSLLVYMFIFRHQIIHGGSLKNHLMNGSHHFNIESNMIPTIMATDDNGGIVYNADANLYEDINLERIECDTHLYQTIKLGNDNYSDISVFGPSAIDVQHDERDNSIYGMDEFDVNISTDEIDSTGQLNNEMVSNLDKDTSDK